MINEEYKIRLCKTLLGVSPSRGGLTVVELKQGLSSLNNLCNNTPDIYEKEICRNLRKCQRDSRGNKKTLRKDDLLKCLRPHAGVLKGSPIEAEVGLAPYDILEEKVFKLSKDPQARFKIKAYQAKAVNMSLDQYDRELASNLLNAIENVQDRRKAHGLDPLVFGLTTKKSVKKQEHPKSVKTKQVQSKKVKVVSAPKKPQPLHEDSLKTKFKVGDLVMWRINIVYGRGEIEKSLSSIRQKINTLRKLSELGIARSRLTPNTMPLPDGWEAVYDLDKKKYYYWNKIDNTSSFDPPPLELDDLERKEKELLDRLEKKRYIPDKLNQIRYGEIISRNGTDYEVKRIEEPSREQKGIRRKSIRVQNKTGKPYNHGRALKEREEKVNLIFDRAEKEQGLETLTSHFGSLQREPGAVQYRSGMPPLIGEGYKHQQDEKVGLMKEKNLLSISHLRE